MTESIYLLSIFNVQYFKIWNYLYFIFYIIIISSSSSSSSSSGSSSSSSGLK